MEETTPAERIEELEARIEALGEAIARSRRLRFVGRAAAAGGPVLLVLLALGAFDTTPARVLGALALTIGGIVLAGSSRSSTDALERTLALVERERNAAIDALGLVAADDGD